LFLLVAGPEETNNLAKLLSTTRWVAHGFTSKH
jgi:hypothetical protein